MKFICPCCKEELSTRNISFKNISFFRCDNCGIFLKWAKFRKRIELILLIILLISFINYFFFNGDVNFMILSFSIYSIFSFYPLENDIEICEIKAKNKSD